MESAAGTSKLRVHEETSNTQVLRGGATPQPGVGAREGSGENLSYPAISELPSFMLYPSRHSLVSYKQLIVSVTKIVHHFSSFSSRQNKINKGPAGLL